MKILQGGSPKCGNFYLYKIIQQILLQNGIRPKNFITGQPIYSLARNWELNYPEQAEIDVFDITDLGLSYRISSIFRMPIDSVENYVAATDHVWTHSPICKKSEKLFSLFDRKIYILRDPRDRAISAAKYYCSPYMFKFFPQEITDPDQFLQVHFKDLMSEWVWHVYDHLRFSKDYGIKLVSYEGFLLDFQRELSGLLIYLGIDLSMEKRKKIQENLAFEKLQKKNPNHLKTGSSGHWRTKLTAEQKEISLKICGPLLKFLKYPLTDQDPNLPDRNYEGDFDILKEDMITSQKFLFTG